MNVESLTDRERHRLIIAQARAAADCAECFNERYVDRFPPNTGSLITLQEGASYGIHVGGSWVSAQRRQRILALTGEVFGRDGWSAVMNPARTQFDWVKVVDGVTVKIYGAAPLQDFPESTPVSAERFPWPGLTSEGAQQ
jgi:hypothetical protein